VRCWTPLLLSLVAGVVHSYTYASDTPPSNASSTIVYDAEYFGRFEVFTALDMLRRVPGVSSILNAAASADDVRGFGSAGDQILINGRRIAGKANELIPALERIQPSLVRRIELIRGTSPGVSVRSEGVLVNVVLRQDAGAVTSMSWQLGATYLLDTELRPVGSLSYGGDIGSMTYLLSTELTQSTLSRQLRDHWLFSPSGTQFAYHDEIRDEDTREVNLASNLLYRLERGSELRLNGLLLRNRDVTDEPRDRFDLDDADAAQFTSRRTRREASRVRGWELGGDYRHPLGESGVLNFLFVYTAEDSELIQWQRLFSPAFEQLISLEETQAEISEAILRGSHLWHANETHGLEVGLERALNELDTDFRLFVDVDGSPVEVDVFNSESVVDEVRWEAFATHNWTISETWSLETSLNAEFSRISQSGTDVGTSRRFSYLKPRFDLRHDLTADDQLRLRVERSVSQLDFANFIASFDAEVDQVRGGNPQLQPQTAWELELAYEKRLSSDSGVLAARAFYNDIRNHIDRIAITERRSALGNLGDGWHTGGELSLSLRLGWLRLPDAVLNATYMRQWSRVLDPLTNERRAFSMVPAYEWRLDFRHDLNRPRLSYGAELRRLGPRITNEVPWYRNFRSKHELTAFFEMSLRQGITLLVEGSMLAWDEANRNQRFFVVNRGDGQVLRTERMYRQATPQIAIRLRGRL
jgi:outer membrane receptor for ferrienterochelin and colicins